MQRALASIFILSLLAANVAWAVDMHCNDAFSDGSPVLSAGDVPANDHAGHYDHCCHGSAHFQGVVAVPLTTESGTVQNLVAFRATARFSRTTTPPTRPPQV